MAFEVLITDSAWADLDVIVDFIRREGSLDAGRKWLLGITRTIELLREMPGRCVLAPEAQELDEVRVLLHGKRKWAYKIYFQIVEGSVIVFHVRHWARKPVDADELQDLLDESEIDPTDREH